MNNIIRINNKVNYIKPKIKLDYLLNGYGNFFQISIINEHFYIDTTEYIKLGNIKELNPYEFLIVLKLYFYSIELNKDYLFFIDEYVQNENNFYIKRNEKGIIIDSKFIFIPTRYNISDKNIILNFINSLKYKLNNEGIIYLNDIYSFINDCNPSYLDIIKRIENFIKDYKSFGKY